MVYFKYSDLQKIISVYTLQGESFSVNPSNPLFTSSQFQTGVRWV